MISSGAVAETVIQAALNLKGTVYFADANDNAFWLCSGAFTGFSVPPDTHIVSDTKTGRTYITVPNGYTGVAFNYNQGPYFEDVSIRGLAIVENGTPASNWTGIKIEINGTEAMSYCHFSDINIHNASVGIELECANSRWIESNHFQDIVLYQCRTGMLFDLQSGNIHRNLFDKVVVQASSSALTTNGFKDIDGAGNVFVGCDTWDFVEANTEANIKSTATHTMIIGGQMTGRLGHFVDQGFQTLIVDSGSSNANNTVITRPDFAKYGSFSARHATNAEGILNGITATIAVGTGSDTGGTLDSTGMYRNYDTGATINSLAGLRTNTAHFTRVGNLYFKTAIYLNSVTNVRVYAGIVNDTAAPASAADPLNVKKGVGLWLDSAVSANWKRGHNDGTSVGVYDDTSVVATTGTLYPVEIYGIWDGKFRFIFNGVSTDITTDIPDSGSGQTFWIYMENTTGASRTMRVYYVTVRNDK